MKVRAQIQVGRTAITVEGEPASQKDVFKMLGFFMEMNGQVCGLCESDNLALEHRAVKGNDYYSIRCKACSGELNYGQHKTGDTLFQKNNGEWTKYEAKSDQPAAQGNTDAPGW